jgi:hypothetical protein
VTWIELTQGQKVRVDLEDYALLKRYSWCATGFKGVSRLKGKFRARIHLNGREKSLGVYATAQEAAQAYDRASKQHFGDFACNVRRRT